MAEVSTPLAILIAVFGASGWATTGITLWNQRQQRRSRERKILQRTQIELDSNQLFQKVLENLEAEKAKRDVPNLLPPSELRRLPAFLEEVATHWEFNIVSLRAAYEVVGPTVTLCDDSQLLWEGESPPRGPIYWRLFNKFAAAIGEERQRRGDGVRR